LKTLGIISEYNPFHNGHKYHIETAKKLTGAQCAVAVMSGSFVQRGDVSLFSKYKRAEIAVRNGIDLVIELPAYFSLKSAEGFAKGGVALLDSINADYISFGAETDDLNLLKESAKILKEEKGDFKTVLKENLKEGKPFAAARAAALSAVFKKGADVIMKPNNILATEYLAAISALKSDMKPVPVKRAGAEHDSETADGNFSSASNIRRLIYKEKDVSSFVPSLPDEKPVFLKDYEKLILYSLTTASEETLSRIHGGSDGVWQRIISSPMGSIEEVLEAAKTKRFALSRIRRFILNLLIQNTLPENLSPSYIRILALNSTGAAFIKEKGESFKLPLAAKPAHIKADDEIFMLERRASKVRALCDGITKDDIYMSPIFVK